MASLVTSANLLPSNPDLPPPNSQDSNSQESNTSDSPNLQHSNTSESPNLQHSEFTQSSSIQNNNVDRASPSHLERFKKNIHRDKDEESLFQDSINQDDSPSLPNPPPLPSLSNDDNIENISNIDIEPTPSPQSSKPKALHFQLIPSYDNGHVNSTIEVLDRHIREGELCKVGRLVIKEGQAAQEDLNELDVWYPSKVVSRSHAEIWLKDGQLYIKDNGSSSGTFLNKLRLSPSGKDSKPHIIRENDHIQFGVDFKGKSEDIFKAVSVRIGFYDNVWLKQLRKKTNPALHALIAASNPHTLQPATIVIDDTDDVPSTDCCICIGTIAPLQAIFISPCSHVYHFKCVTNLLLKSQMFSCPMCRQVANLAASVSVEELGEKTDEYLAPVKTQEKVHSVKAPTPVDTRRKSNGNTAAVAAAANGEARRKSITPNSPTTPNNPVENVATAPLAAVAPVKKEHKDHSHEKKDQKEHSHDKKEHKDHSHDKKESGEKKVTKEHREEHNVSPTGAELAAMQKSASGSASTNKKGGFGNFFQKKK